MWKQIDNNMHNNIRNIHRKYSRQNVDQNVFLYHCVQFGEAKTVFEKKILLFLVYGNEAMYMLFESISVGRIPLFDTNKNVVVGTV